MNTEQFLILKGYSRLLTSAPWIQAMYRITMDRVLCILIVNTAVSGYGEDLHLHIKDRLRASFMAKGYSQILVHTLIVSPPVREVKEIAFRDSDCWILDVSSGRVLLFENTAADFDGLRSGIEEAWARDFTTGAALAYGRAMKQRAREGRRELTFFSVINGYIRNNEATVALFLMNVMVFIALSIFGSTTDPSFMARHGAMYPSYLVVNKEIYRLFTSMFMHFGFMHLAVNMLALILIGGQVEDILGKARYLFLYLFSGIFAGFVSFITAFITNSGAVSAGASGAIFGLIGSLFAIVIKNRGKYKDLTVSRIAFLVGYSLYAGFTAAGVDNAAHIGGLIMGLVIGAIVYSPDREDSRGNHFNRAV